MNTKNFVKCRVCNSVGRESGYLFRCGDPKCGAVHWDKAKIKHLKDVAPEEIQQVLGSGPVNPLAVTLAA